MTTNDDSSVLISVHDVRGRFYTFFGQCFNMPPDEDFYSLVSGMVPQLEQLASSCDNDDMHAGVSGIKNFIYERESLADTLRREFDEEELRKYTNMFCIPNAVAMDESIYTSPEHLVMQDSFIEMQHLFAKYGYKLSAGISQYEDSFTVELFFMGRLSYDTATIAESGHDDAYFKLIDEQVDFHKKRFDVWIYELFDKILAFQNDEMLFKSLTKYVRGYIIEDKLFLAEISSAKG